MRAASATLRTKDGMLPPCEAPVLPFYGRQRCSLIHPQLEVCYEGICHGSVFLTLTNFSTVWGRMDTQAYRKEAQKEGRKRNNELIRLFFSMLLEVVKSPEALDLNE